MRRFAFSPVAAVISLLLLAGCESQREQLLEQGYPVSYADGFEDGCHSGKRAGGALFEDFKKDVRRFERDKRYAQGWSDAFRQCESEQEAMDRQMRMSLEIQQMEEARQERITKDAFSGLSKKQLKQLERDLKNLK